MKGFISTSRSREIAERYLKVNQSNCFLIIKTPKIEATSEFFSGFADISAYAVDSREEEIIYNLLNYFKIIDVTLLDNVYYITLEFISAAQLAKEVSEERENLDAYLIRNYKQYKSLRHNVCNQGDCMFSINQLPESEDWYLCYHANRIKQWVPAEIEEEYEIPAYLINKLRAKLEDTVSEDTIRRYFVKTLREPNLNPEGWIEKITEIFHKQLNPSCH